MLKVDPLSDQFLRLLNLCHMAQIAPRHYPEHIVEQCAAHI